MSAIPAQLDPFPWHWYAFFGILEPISVAAGAGYAIGFTERYHHELVPPAFATKQMLGSMLGYENLQPAARMAIGQLGSCYILIMLNSTLTFYALRKHVRDPVVLETLIKYVMVVLGVADWTHILITIFSLPEPSRALGTNRLTLLSQPSSWNSLLFGNIIITFILFSFRCAWWFGIARASPSKATSKAKRG